jgi:hypothetical protein
MVPTGCSHFILSCRILEFLKQVWLSLSGKQIRLICLLLPLALHQGELFQITWFSVSIFLCLLSAIQLSKGAFLNFWSIKGTCFFAGFKSTYAQYHVIDVPLLLCVFPCYKKLQKCVCFPYFFRLLTMLSTPSVKLCTWSLQHGMVNTLSSNNLSKSITYVIY